MRVVSTRLNDGDCKGKAEEGPTMFGIPFEMGYACLQLGQIMLPSSIWILRWSARGKAGQRYVRRADDDEQSERGMRARDVERSRESTLQDPVASRQDPYLTNESSL